jgi:protein-L-isoaspartate(D-aspartate) O-methyltransferase
VGRTTDGAFNGNVEAPLAAERETVMPPGHDATAEKLAMTDELSLQRRFFADEVQAVGNIRNSLLIEALATVPRERFLRPGPWVIRGEGDFGGAVRQTMDADPRHVYHNVSVAIDSNRQLFNGAPSVVASWIDALDLQLGDRVLHVGFGLGYCSGAASMTRSPTPSEALASRCEVRES